MPGRHSRAGGPRYERRNDTSHYQHGHAGKRLASGWQAAAKEIAGWEAAEIFSAR